MATPMPKRAKISLFLPPDVYISGDQDHHRSSQFQNLKQCPKTVFADRVKDESNFLHGQLLRQPLRERSTRQNITQFRKSLDSLEKLIKKSYEIVKNSSSKKKFKIKSIDKPFRTQTDQNYLQNIPNIRFHTQVSPRQTWRQQENRQQNAMTKKTLIKSPSSATFTPYNSTAIKPVFNSKKVPKCLQTPLNSTYAVKVEMKRQLSGKKAQKSAQTPKNFINIVKTEQKARNRPQFVKPRQASSEKRLRNNASSIQLSTNYNPQRQNRESIYIQINQSKQELSISKQEPCIGSNQVCKEKPQQLSIEKQSTIQVNPKRRFYKYTEHRSCSINSILNEEREKKSSISNKQKRKNISAKEQKDQIKSDYFKLKKKYAFIDKYLTEAQIGEIYLKLETSNLERSRWPLVLIDKVYEKMQLKK